MKANIIVDMYCDNCDRHTKHKFMGNCKDGLRTLGRYICKDCGIEREGESRENPVIAANGKPITDKIDMISFSR